ncbi:MAG TPA: NIPSNAP family protein, partial [Sphingomicrobium sp.]|nr:NIPSNAP family protein [Sphingomicrobium sp.]
MNSLIELRVYTLKPGTRAAFQQRFEEQILPMLNRYRIELVRAGPSLHDELSFHLLRRPPQPVS